MSPDVGRAAFGAAMFIIVCALVLLLFVPRGTAEHAITVVSLFIGIVFSAVVAVLIRVSSR